MSVDNSSSASAPADCGGEIDVWVEAYEPGAFEDAARTGARAAEVTLLEGPRAGAKRLVTPETPQYAAKSEPSG